MQGDKKDKKIVAYRLVAPQRRHDFVPGSKAKPTASSELQETKSLERLSKIVQNNGLSALTKSEQELSLIHI